MRGTRTHSQALTTARVLAAVLIGGTFAAETVAGRDQAARVRGGDDSAVLCLPSLEDRRSMDAKPPLRRWSEVLCPVTGGGSGLGTASCCRYLSWTEQAVGCCVVRKGGMAGLLWVTTHCCVGDGLVITRAAAAVDACE